MAVGPQKDWPNVRLRPDLNEELDTISRQTGVSRVGMVTEAVERWLRRRELGDRWEDKNPALTPMTPEESEAVRMILAIARQPDNRAEESALKLMTDLYLLRLKKTAQSSG
jgi:hypothetical protein